MKCKHQVVLQLGRPVLTLPIVTVEEQATSSFFIISQTLEPACAVQV